MPIFIGNHKKLKVIEECLGFLAREPYCSMIKEYEEAGGM
jgi:hypothetical protein